MSFCEFAPIAQCVYHQVGDCFHGLRRSHTWGESWLQTLTSSMNSPGHSRHHSSSSRCTLLTTRFITRKASRRGRTDRTFSWQCGCKSTHSPLILSFHLPPFFDHPQIFYSPLRLLRMRGSRINTAWGFTDAAHAFNGKVTRTLTCTTLLPTIIWIGRTVIGSIQSLFYAVRLGVDSGFLMLLVVSLIYPTNSVT